VLTQSTIIEENPSSSALEPVQMDSDSDDEEFCRFEQNSEVTKQMNGSDSDRQPPKA